MLTGTNNHEPSFYYPAGRQKCRALHSLLGWERAILGFLLKMFELEASPEFSCCVNDNVLGMRHDVEPSEAANFSTGPECTTVKRWAYYIASMFKRIYSLQIVNGALRRRQIVLTAKRVSGPNAVKAAIPDAISRRIYLAHP
jgi:hypothetical protein